MSGMGMHAGTTITTGEGLGMATGADVGVGEVTHDKDLPDNVLTSGGEGGDGGGSDVGRRESIGTSMGIGVAHDNGMVMDVGSGTGRVDENSQLDPKILMESVAGGARGWGAVERRTLDQPQQAPDSPQVRLLPQVQIAPSNPPPTSTSLWPVGLPPQLHPVQYQSTLATAAISTTTSAAIIDSALSTATYVPQHPDCSSHPYSQSTSTSLTYQQQIRSQDQLTQSQQQSQAPVRVSTLPQLEVPIPLSNTTPSIADSITAAFPSINQNPQRSRSGSTSPWPRGNIASANVNVNPDENASSSSSAGGGGSGAKQNGFGSSALTYDSFWSGFKGSTTPNTTISLPASTQALTTSASTPGITGGSTRTRINFNAGRGLTPAPLATPTGNVNAFDMEIMGINMGIGMDGMMNMGMVGMGMGMALTDDTTGDGVGSYGFER
jgi:hypothetical protein